SRPRAGRPIAARARSARGTSRPYPGSGSPAARPAAARPCSCLRPQARLWQRSSPGHRVEEVEEAGEAYSDALRALDVDAVAGDEAGDRPEHGNPVVAAGVDPPSGGTVGDAADTEAVRPRLDPDAD